VLLFLSLFSDFKQTMLAAVYTTRRCVFTFPRNVVGLHRRERRMFTLALNNNDFQFIHESRRLYESRASSVLRRIGT